MRRSALVVATTLLAALALGLHTATRDITEEQEGALALAHTLARLQVLSSQDAVAAQASLRNLRQGEHELRHLRLEVTDDTGRLLLRLGAHDTPTDTADPSLAARMGAPVQEAVLDIHRRLFPMPALPPQVQHLNRPDGAKWTLTLHASPESERLEALSGLLDQLGVLCAMGIGLLLMLRVNLGHALGPVATLLNGIGRLEKQDTKALRHLPPMPVQELEQIAAALRHLAESLDRAESRRRVLAHQLSELQESERQRIASDLHDELGQHLTALRLDLSWLQRQLETAPDPTAGWLAPALGVTCSMTEHCRTLQRDLRNLLTRLRPFGHASEAERGDDGRIDLGALQELIQALADSWHSSSREPVFQIDWELNLSGPTGHRLDTAGISLEHGQALALFRLTQEALTNIARHAGARQALLRVDVKVEAQPDPASLPHARPALTIEWRCEDDGVGLPVPDSGDATTAMRRGNGLAGMQERVWLLGGQWHIGRSPALGGLQLRARLTEPGTCLNAPPDCSSAPPPDPPRRSVPAPN